MYLKRPTSPCVTRPHSLHCAGGRITWKLEMGTRDSNFAISQLPNRRIADITTYRRVANRDGSDGISKTKTEIVDRSWHSDFSSLPVLFPNPTIPRDLRFLTTTTTSASRLRHQSLKYCFSAFDLEF